MVQDLLQTIQDQILQSCEGDLGPLSRGCLTQLQTLKLGCFRGDLSPLSTLIQLQLLDLFGFTEGDLSPLSTLTHLQYLNLNCFHEGDLSPLSALTQLQSLNLKEFVGGDLLPLPEEFFLIKETYGGDEARRLSS